MWNYHQAQLFDLEQKENVMEVALKKYVVNKSGARGAKITLPQSWIKLMGLDLKDEVLISQDDRGRLIISKIEQSRGGAS